LEVACNFLAGRTCPKPWDGRLAFAKTPVMRSAGPGRAMVQSTVQQLADKGHVVRNSCMFQCIPGQRWRRDTGCLPPVGIAWVQAAIMDMFRRLRTWKSHGGLFVAGSKVQTGVAVPERLALSRKDSSKGRCRV